MGERIIRRYEHSKPNYLKLLGNLRARGGNRKEAEKIFAELHTLASQRYVPVPRQYSENAARRRPFQTPRAKAMSPHQPSGRPDSAQGKPNSPGTTQRLGIKWSPAGSFAEMESRNVGGTLSHAPPVQVHGERRRRVLARVETCPCAAADLSLCGTPTKRRRSARRRPIDQCRLIGVRPAARRRNRATPHNRGLEVVIARRE
jgi:hypothetical protein